MKRVKTSVVAAVLAVLSAGAANASQVNTDPIGILGAGLYNYAQSDSAGAFKDLFTFTLGGSAATDTLTLTESPASLGILLHETITSFGLATSDGTLITPTVSKIVNTGLYNGPEYVYSGLTKGTSYEVIVNGTATGVFGGKDDITVNVTPSPVPLPGAAWLFLGSLAGLSFVQYRRRSNNSAA